MRQKCSSPVEMGKGLGVSKLLQKSSKDEIANLGAAIYGGNDMAARFDELLIKA